MFRFVENGKTLVKGVVISMKIGAQLYTLRDYCKDSDSFENTLNKVADIGYTSIQVSGTCSYDPHWLAEKLKSAGLTCDLTHINVNDLAQNTDKVIADHNIFGCDYIGIGWYNGLKNDDDIPKLVDIAKSIAPKMKENKKFFMYHNHFQEFAKTDRGETKLLELVSKTAPDELGVTLDTYWVQYGGADLNDYIPLLKGRIPCVHLKDMKVDSTAGEVRMASVGDGNINFEKLIKLFEDNGTKYMFVEQDFTYGEDPFICLKRSYDYLHSLGLD